MRVLSIYGFLLSGCALQRDGEGHRYGFVRAAGGALAGWTVFMHPATYPCRTADDSVHGRLDPSCLGGLASNKHDLLSEDAA